MQPETQAKINSVVTRARRGELAAAADEAEMLLNAAGKGTHNAASISQALQRQLLPHGLADEVKRRAGITFFPSPTAKLPAGLTEKLDQEKAAVATFFRRLIAVAEVVVEPVHAAVVGLRDSLITVCAVMEDRNEAVRACEQALAIAESHLDAGQESAIRYRQWLSRLYREAGQLDKAEAVYDSLTVCQHLQPLLNALRASGTETRDVRSHGSRKRFIVDAPLDCEELKQSLGLPDCVQARVEDFAAPQWEEGYLLNGLVCEEDDHGVFGAGRVSGN
jgi:hypothetical protein